MSRKAVLKQQKASRYAESLQWIVGAAIFLGLLISFVPLKAGAEEKLHLATQQPIKIEFSHGSGVNPRHFERWDCKLDTKAMKPDDAVQLSKLVESSSIMTSKDSDYSTTEGGPFYSLEIRKGKEARKFSWSYEHCPGSIQPLIRFLIDHSQKKVFEMGKEVI